MYEYAGVLAHTLDPVDSTSEVMVPAPLHLQASWLMRPRFLLCRNMLAW
jgi:hypothetical protein